MSGGYAGPAVGEELRSAARTVTETDIVVWSGLVGDWNPAHVDVEHAKGTPFGQRIAHGNIAFNLSVSLAAASLPGVYRPPGFERLLGWERVRFTAPVLIGDTIHAVRTVAEVGADSEQGTTVIVYDVRVANQRDETVMVGTERMLVRAEPPAANGGD
jgi:acyl dehydratase